MQSFEFLSVIGCRVCESAPCLLASNFLMFLTSSDSHHSTQSASHAGDPTYKKKLRFPKCKSVSPYLRFNCHVLPSASYSKRAYVQPPYQFLWGNLSQLLSCTYLPIFILLSLDPTMNTGHQAVQNPLVDLLTADRHDALQTDFFSVCFVEQNVLYPRSIHHKCVHFVRGVPSCM